jgi:hypothetical protein
MNRRYAPSTGDDRVVSADGLGISEHDSGRPQKTHSGTPAKKKRDYNNMICLVNTNNGDTAVLMYENGTYVLVPDVHPHHRFSVPENARSGTKEFLEVLVNEGWKPD